VTGVDATVAAWDDGQPWLDEILAQLRANRDWLAATLASALPGVTMRVPEATYLAWLDCRALELPCPAGQFFLNQARVGLNFGETFGADYAGFARLNFATQAAILREIIADGGGGAESVKRHPRTSKCQGAPSSIIHVGLRQRGAAAFDE
jgi:cystathionine beta-lyase